MIKSEMEKCIAEYGKDVFSFCCYLTSSRQEAEDLYQDTFLKVMELDELRQDKNPKSYILSIACMLWKNRQRKIANRMRLVRSEDVSDIQESEFFEESSTPEDEVLKNEIKIQVRMAVNELPDKLKVIALLFYMEDRSIREIAEIVQAPQGTVKSRLYKARKLLHKQLEGII